MGLPIIEAPTFMLDIPSTKQAIKYRPFTVKEEKILLIGMQSDNAVEIENTIKQVLNNCIIDMIELNDLATYDIEYIFLQLRAKSVDNVIKIAISDEEDGNVYDVEVNVDDIKVQFNDDHVNIIELNDQVTLIMKDPTYDILRMMESQDNEQDALAQAVIACIDKVMVGDDEVLIMSEYTQKEQIEFIDSFSSKNMQQLERFFDTMPKLSHKIEYTTEDGNKKEREVSGLQSFFSLV